MRPIEINYFKKGQLIIFFDTINYQKIKAIELFFSFNFPKKSNITSDSFIETYYTYYYIGVDDAVVGCDDIPFVAQIEKLSEIFN